MPQVGNDEPPEASIRHDVELGDAIVSSETYRPSTGLRALLQAIPEPGDALDLGLAVAIVSRHDAVSYRQIVAGIVNGLLVAAFVDRGGVDLDVEIRRR